MQGYNYTRLTIFHVLWLVGGGLGFGFGIIFGLKHFGVIGAILGAALGGVCGIMPALLLEHFVHRSLFKEIQQSSSEKLWNNLDKGDWNFFHTMSLLQLAVRGEDIEKKLPRILQMLGSDTKSTRLYGWDAFRIVFTDKAKLIPDYDPNETTEQCRAKLKLIHPKADQA